MREDVRAHLSLIAKKRDCIETRTAQALLDGFPVRSEQAYTRIGGRGLGSLHHTFYPDELIIDTDHQFYTVCDSSHRTHIVYCKVLSPLELLAMEAE